MQEIDGVVYINVDEATKMLGVKKATLYAYVSRGLFQSYRKGVGRQRLYRRDEIEALLAVRSNGASTDEPTTAPATSDPQPESQTEHTIEDGVLRNVSLPSADTWVGDH